jgi:riboflavin transporter FmnP
MLFPKNSRSTVANPLAHKNSLLSRRIQDYLWLTGWAGMLSYFFYKAPVLVGIMIIGLLAVFALNWVSSRLPYFNQPWRTKIRPWHWMVPIGAIALTLNTVTPAHAIFLSGMEEFVTQLATDSAGGGEGISEESIGLVFNVIRAIFLLLVAAAALFAYNQAQQGNDWRPIATQVGLAFGIVLGLDVITAIFVPQGG